MTEEELIRDVEANYDRAWASGNVDDLVALFTPDAVLVNPRGEVAHGRMEIRKALGGFLHGQAANSIHESRIIRIHFATSEVAIVDGEASISGGSHPLITHPFTDILVKNEATWKIAHVRAYYFEEEAKTKNRVTQQFAPPDRVVRDG
jgi:uncharacterized protein (TIGR02246 family)